MSPKVRNNVLFVVGAFALVATGLYFGIRQAKLVEAQVVEKPRPISDVKCGEAYELDHLERFYITSLSGLWNRTSIVAVNFYFGGKDRNLQPQYIWDENVLGQSTELRSRRQVDRSLKYSKVTFVCLSDPMLEGHKISNVKVMRYQLTLRRPLRPQKVIRGGGPARQ